MLKGVTKSGFSYEISDERLENYELFELMAEVDDNPILMPKVVKLMFGEEGTNRLKEHLRNENGFVPMQKFNEEVEQILLAHMTRDELKK